MDTQSNSSLRFMMMDLQLFILVCEYMCIPLIQKETPQAAKFTDSYDEGSGGDDGAEKIIISKWV